MDLILKTINFLIDHNIDFIYKGKTSLAKFFASFNSLAKLVNIVTKLW